MHCLRLISEDQASSGIGMASKLVVETQHTSTEDHKASRAYLQHTMQTKPLAHLKHMNHELIYPLSPNSGLSW